MERFKIIIISFLVLLATNTLAANGHKDCSKDCLLKVFSEKKNSKKQLILKLYCNNEYELLHFSFKKQKKLESRETGTYKKFGPILKFKPTKKVNLIHKDYLFINRKDELYTSVKDLISEKGKIFLPINNHKKYYDSLYVDRYFGVISNKKNDAKKFIERPKYLWYDRYPENATSISKDSLGLIKMVFVVGKNETDDILQRTLKLADYVTNKGVNVTVYTPPTAWKTIAEGSKNAHVFLYAGHGNGDGFYLEEGQISSKEIKRDLKLHKNAVVLFNHVCYGAGSSASDKSQLTDEEATRRVEEYSKTFIELGAGAYYANNKNNCMYSFFDRFFCKNPLKHVVMNSRLNEYNVVVTEESYMYNSEHEILVTCDEYTEGNSVTTTYHNDGSKTVRTRKNFPSYGLAYVGNPDLTILDLLKE